MSYEKYVAWRRITHGGKLGREQMSPEAQAEYDALDITVEEYSQEKAQKRFDDAKWAYEEATGRSRPSSDA